METAQHRLAFTALSDAQAYAEAHQLRQRAVCYIVQGTKVLVFDHVPDSGSGVQAVAGGLEVGETPEQAALREAGEETGHTGFSLPVYLGSRVWLSTAHAKREMRHFVQLTAPDDFPDTWQHHADDHLFSFRWADLHQPGLDWDMDAALPQLHRLLNAQSIAEGAYS